MTPEDISMIRHCLPEDMAFPYYADRESPWLLAQLMGDDAPVTALRRCPAGKLLTRPLVRPVVAACGGGVLRQQDLLAVAHAARAMRMAGTGAAGRAGLEAACALPWQDFCLSFAAWGTRYSASNQMTRRGGNLVVQLGFPSDHADLMGRYLRRDCRKDFEFDLHPIRTSGRPTLAWARLDIDLETGTALIEEVQSDWLRNVREEVADLSARMPRSRQLMVAQRYEAGLIARYSKVWPRALMLAVLVLLRDEFACRAVWMHQPEPGAAFKRIGGTPPPRSLYSALPRGFCFAPTREPPPFLKRHGTLAIARMGRDEPLFWRLDFTPLV